MNRMRILKPHILATVVGFILTVASPIILTIAFSVVPTKEMQLITAVAMLWIWIIGAALFLKGIYGKST